MLAEEEPCMAQVTSSQTTECADFYTQVTSMYTAVVSCLYDCESSAEIAVSDAHSTGNTLYQFYLQSKQSQVCQADPSWPTKVTKSKGL